MIQRLLTSLHALATSSAPDDRGDLAGDSALGRIELPHQVPVKDCGSDSDRNDARYQAARYLESTLTGHRSIQSIVRDATANVTCRR